MTKILIIEDEDVLREEVADILRYESFEVVEANNGEEGIWLAGNQQPDLILCDITMPKSDGYQVLLTLHKVPETASIPFIFLTARADRTFIRHGMELGADDYLTKPFTQGELMAAIRARLDRHQILVDTHIQKLEDVKTALTHLVAHELRTPLVSIMMVQDVIARQLGQLKPTQMQELLEILNAGSKRLSHVVEQMVYLTELEAGTISINRVRENGYAVQIWQIMPAAIDLGRQYALHHRDLPICFQERDPQATVLTYLPALKHALAEVLANALNFSPLGGVITLSGWQAEGCVWITILDQGPGIALNQLEHVFDAFYQIDREIHEQQGVGLGLSLARRIIEAHSGTLLLNSMVNKGTQVTISLPLVSE